MQFHYINTNEAHRQYGAYKKWLNLGYGFTNGELKYGEKLGKFQPGDLVFMYVKEHGIKAVGMVTEEWDGVEYQEPIIPSDTNNEYRVRIIWFSVLPEGFVSPSEIKEILMLRKEGMFAVVGGIVGAVLTMLVGSVVPIGAQNEAADLNVGEITCTGLRVVDGGRIAVIDENDQSVASMGSDRRGGLVALHDKHGKAGVTIRIEEFGGLVSAQSKDGKSFATLIIDNYNGGSVLVIDKNGSSRWLTSGGVSPPMDSR